MSPSAELTAAPQRAVSPQPHLLACSGGDGAADGRDASLQAGPLGTRGGEQLPLALELERERERRLALEGELARARQQLRKQVNPNPGRAVP
jgi:hypothetical protein